MPDDETYPAGMYWVWTRQLGFIGANEAKGVDDHLDGQVLFLKTLVEDELKERPRFLEEWNAASRKVDEADDASELKAARLGQLSVLVSLAKELGILKDADLEKWDLEAFEGDAYDVET